MYFLPEFCQGPVTTTTASYSIFKCVQEQATKPKASSQEDGINVPKVLK